MMKARIASMEQSSSCAISEEQMNQVWLLHAQELNVERLRSSNDLRSRVKSLGAPISRPPNIFKAKFCCFLTAPFRHEIVPAR